jgi:hypothetical protein
MHERCLQAWPHKQCGEHFATCFITFIGVHLCESVVRISLKPKPHGRRLAWYQCLTRWNRGFTQMHADATVPLKHLESS